MEATTLVPLATQLAEAAHLLHAARRQAAQAQRGGSAVVLREQGCGEGRCVHQRGEVGDA